MLLLLVLAIPPPTQPPVRVVAVDGGSALTVTCTNCSGGGGGSAGGLTNTELRAGPVPMYMQDAGVLNVNPVGIANLPVVFIGDAGVLNVNFPASQTVNGTVTALQGAGSDGGNWQTGIVGAVSVNLLDAGVLNVALPSGAATSARQDTGNTSLANLDVALSTRTKPADQQHVIIDSSAGIAVTLATAPSTPITAATLPLPSGAATDATLSQLLDGGVGLLSTIAANQTSGNEQVQIILNRYPLNPFLPRCNPVRRTGCQP